MNKSTIVIILVLIVAAIFFFKPYLLGKGAETPLAIVPTEDTMTVPTDYACQTVQQCLDYAKTLDPAAADIQATCTGTCNFIVPKAPIVEVTP